MPRSCAGFPMSSSSSGPICLAEGWDPEFPDKPEVCLVAKDLDSPLSYTHDRRSVRRFLHPTMRDSSGRFNDGVVLCHL